MSCLRYLFIVNSWRKHLVYLVEWLALGRASNHRNHAKTQLEPGAALWFVKLLNPCQFGKPILNDVFFILLSFLFMISAPVELATLLSVMPHHAKSNISL